MTNTSPGSKWMMRATLAPHVALDEAVLAVVRTRQRKMAPQLLRDRNAAEMAAASALFGERGWLGDPTAYHRIPPPLRDADLVSLGKGLWPQGYETVTFPSVFRPRDIEPGVDRWACNQRNDTVPVRLLRHPGPRPWVVCLHGFGMGASRLDLIVMWATFLHKRLGFNVAVPVLPLHGPRRSSGDDQLLSMDLAVTLHAISQAIWEIRRLVGWIRDTSGSPVGVYGLSLGGYLAAMLSGLERLDGVVAAVPFVDFLEVMAHHRPPPGFLEDTIRADDPREVFSVASPLAMVPLLPTDRCTVFAARGDRLIPRQQSVALRQAWQGCELRLHHGGHVGFPWSRQNRDVVSNRLQTALCIPLQP